MSRRALPGITRKSGEGLGEGSRARFAVLLIFICVLLAGGGASRDDVQSLLFVRPAAVLCSVALLMLPGRIDFRPIRVPLLLLGALAATMLMQLVPMPPALWTRLPGHEVFAEAAIAAGVPQPWRPISVAPDLTLNSLVSLLVPLTALIGIATLDRGRLHALLPLFIGAVFISALVAIAQLTGGAGSAFYLYDVTNSGAGVGLFANRNHQATLLAAVFPMLSAWACLPAKDEGYRRTRLWTTIALGLFLMPMIAVTGSRAGLALGVLGLVSAVLLYKRMGGRPLAEGMHGKRALLIKLLPWVLGAAVMTLTVHFSRAKAIQRLIAPAGSDFERVSNIPQFVDIASDFFPVGSGAGTFDRVFRAYEPFELLRTEYLNHAHNEPMELLITGGLPAVIILALFIVWWLRSTRFVLGGESVASTSRLFATLGSVIIMLALLASLVDYPLRTPIFSFFAALACGWLGAATVERRKRSHSPELDQGIDFTSLPYGAKPSVRDGSIL